LKEHNKSNKSENTQAVLAQLAKIHERLNCIQESLGQIRKQSESHWSYSLGFSGMAMGAGMVTAGASLSHIPIVLGGAVVFALGIALMLRSQGMLSKSKNKPDEKGIKEQ